MFENNSNFAKSPNPPTNNTMMKFPNQPTYPANKVIVEFSHFWHILIFETSYFFCNRLVRLHHLNFLGPILNHCPLLIYSR